MCDNVGRRYQQATAAILLTQRLQNYNTSTTRIRSVFRSPKYNEPEQFQTLVQFADREINLDLIAMNNNHGKSSACRPHLTNDKNRVKWLNFFFFLRKKDKSKPMLIVKSTELSSAVGLAIILAKQTRTVFAHCRWFRKPR